MQLTISAIGVLVFSGLTAYDTQRIKLSYLQSGGWGEGQQLKAAVNGALMLYLDFINLFLSLLRLFRDDKLKKGADLKAPFSSDFIRLPGAINAFKLMVFNLKDNWVIHPSKKFESIFCWRVKLKKDLLGIGAA